MHKPHATHAIRAYFDSRELIDQSAVLISGSNLMQVALRDQIARTKLVIKQSREQIARARAN